MDGARAVVVRSGSAEGSGYVLGGRLVLTAAHVLRDRGEVSVQLPGRQGRVVCRVVWDRLDEGPQGWDAALLLAGGPLSEKALPPVRWGRLVTLEGCPAQVIGYPVVGQAGADVVTRVQREGRVMPESGRDRDRYVLSGDAGAETQADGLSPWSGMSGAALWCGSTPGMPPLLTGVVAGDPPGLSHTRLEAVPAYVLASDPSFRSVVEEHTGRAMLLEPADLQHVTDRTAHPRPPRSPADLLRPEHAVVSFMGREKILAELVHWCQEQDRHDPGDGTTTHGTWLWDGGPVKAQLLTGGGGAGKTRLATELCALMTGRGWTTIRLTTDISKPLDALTQVRRPLLIVADYAETRIPQLHALLDAVDHDQAHTPVRILALARAAGDWWTRATAHPHSQALAAATVTAVPALHHTVPDRAAAYRQAVTDFVVRLRRMAPGADWTAHVPVLTAPDALPSLARAEFDTPLSVQMAALLALLDATGTPRPTTQQTTSLEGRLLGHEQKYWDETAVSSERGLSGERSGSETRALAVALACLTHATDRSHARELLARLPGLADEGAAAVRGSLTTWLGDLYPAPAGSLWGSIQPDRIAEYHLGAEARREPALFASILATLREEHSAQALTVLARTAQHAQHHETVSSVLRDAITAAPNRLGPAALTTATLTPYPEPLIIALTHLIENTHDIGLMYQLSNQLTHFTLALSEWAAALNAALVEHHDTPTPDLPRLATALNNQAIGLANLGRREEALSTITRAVEIRETLAAQQPDAFLPDLASSLNNQSIRLADLGHREEALSTITRAVEIRETLAAQQPDAFLPDLAGSLTNQSNCLSKLGSQEEALEIITRVVNIHETLAKERPNAFLPNLAAALNNQCECLADLGHPEQALIAITRAVEIRETLAAQQPDAFLPDLAGSLNNQSNRMAELGHRKEALATITRAVEAYQALAEKRPSAFLLNLAGSLNNQSARLADLGRPDEALISITRAVEIRETLAAQQPDVFLPDLAGSLYNQSVLLAGLERRQEALATITRAVQTYQTLAEKRPTLFASELKSAIQLSQFLRPAIEG